MFTDLWPTAIHAESHRRDLLADAANHRLAKEALAGRRRARRRSPVPPVSPPTPHDPGVDRPTDNTDANRRYLVPR